MALTEGNVVIFFLSVIGVTMFGAWTIGYLIIGDYSSACALAICSVGSFMIAVGCLAGPGVKLPKVNVNEVE